MCQQSERVDALQSVPDTVHGGEEDAPVEPAERCHHTTALDTDGVHRGHHGGGHRWSVRRHPVLQRLGHPHARRRGRPPHRLRLFPVKPASSFPSLLLRPHEHSLSPLRCPRFMSEVLNFLLKRNGNFNSGVLVHQFSFMEIIHLSQCICT